MIDIRNFSILFDRFKRISDSGLTAGGQTEDVTLEVKHINSSGAVVSTLEPWTVKNAALRQQHFWSEGHGNEQPRFLRLKAPGDTVTISVTGRDGTVSTTLTPAGIVAGTACIGASVDVNMPPQSFFYQVFRRCTVDPQSVP